MSDCEAQSERLIIAFAGLRISIERSGSAASSSASASSYQVVSSPGARSTTGPLAGEESSQPSVATPHPEDRFRLFTSAEETLLTSTSPDDIGTFELGHLRSLSSSLAAVGPWSAQARIARAYRAGLAAFLVVEGARLRVVLSPPLDLRNRWYVCLECRAYPDGFLTSSYRTFIRHCPHRPNGDLEEGSVSHAFATRSEVSAYLAGARAPWPREL